CLVDSAEGAEAAVLDVQEPGGTWHLTRDEVDGNTVAVDHELGDMGQQTEQVLAAALPACPDPPLGDVVSAPCDPFVDPSDVELGRGESDVPDADGLPLVRGLEE